MKNLTEDLSLENSHENNDNSILNVLIIFLKNIKLLFVIPLLSSLVSIFYLIFFSVPIYKSSSTFMSTIDNGNSQSQVMGIAAQLGFSILDDKSAQWSYLDVVKSRSLAINLLERKFDTSLLGKGVSLYNIINNDKTLIYSKNDKMFYSSIAKVQRMVQIFTTGTIYNLEISSIDPNLSAQIATAVIEELNKHQKTYNNERSSKTLDFIRGRLASTKINLELAEESLKDFRASNRNIYDSPHLIMQQERMLRDLAVMTGVYTALHQQFESAKIDNIKETDYVVLLDDPNVPSYPVRPKKKIIVILSILFGFGLSIIVVLLKEKIIKSKIQNKDKINEIKLFFKR